MLGTGLLHTGFPGDSSRTIIGAWNRDDADPDNVFIVGDGFIKDGVVSEGENINDHTDLYGEGDKINWYRHNLFVVNRQGWAGLYSYDDPATNNVRYSYDGIYATINGQEININFYELKSKMATSDFVNQCEAKVNQLQEDVQRVHATTPGAAQFFLKTGALTLNLDAENISAGTVVTVMNIASETGFVTFTQLGGTSFMDNISPAAARSYIRIDNADENVHGFAQINN